MSESFSDLPSLPTGYGDVRTRLVDQAVAPYEAELLRQWRVSQAAPAISEVGMAAGSLDTVPLLGQIPAQRMGEVVAEATQPFVTAI